MEQRLKQRLVGASVLVLVVVVFVPELFEAPAPDEPTQPQPIAATQTESTSSHETSVVTPEQVAEVVVTPVEEAAPDTPGEERVAIAPHEVDAVAPAVETAIPVPRSKPAGGVSELPSTAAWVVQLASFSESARAVTLRDELVGKGYAAFIRSSSGDSGTFARVLVGPTVDKGAAERLRGQLLEQTKLQGQVLRFQDS